MSAPILDAGRFSASRALGLVIYSMRTKTFSTGHHRSRRSC